MAGWLEKMTEEAARLVLPPGRHPAQELARYRHFLKIQSHRLKILHRNGGGGQEVCRARAAMLDLVVKNLFAALQALAKPAEWQPLALIAVGGYGRGELNPWSDVDLLFLQDRPPGRGPAHPALALIGEGILSDLGLKVGHATRTIEECVAEANKEMQSKTALIEARFLCGDEKLFQRLKTQLLKRCVKGREAEYIAARLADQAARRQRFGNSPVMQEPHLKNGCGGLRDYQNLLWMTYFKYGVGQLEELVKAKMVYPAEARDLQAAYDYLLRVRTELHYQSPRPQDILTKHYQPTVAWHLGFKERSAWVRIENFMREYYTHTRNIYLITRTVEQRLALAPQENRLLKSLPRLWRKSRQPAVVDGFRIQGGQMGAASSRIFDEAPHRLMRAFLLAQQRGLIFEPELVQLMRNKLPLVNRGFLNSSRVRETFLEILNHRGSVGAILRQMHEVGLLGKYVPEFGRLTNLVQHEFYHQYAADEHTLVCLEKLDVIWEAKTEPFLRYGDLLRAVEKPYLLNLALLLHDAGKAGNTSDHAEVGARLARNFAQRMALDGAATRQLCHLIQHHLDMARISQRRDLNDPQVIAHFAQIIETEEQLRLLTLLTVADLLGTSEKLWNGFKDSLLWQLYQKTSDYLRGIRPPAEEAEKHRQLLALELARQLPRHIAEEELYAHFQHLPVRYFQQCTPQEILLDLELAHQFMRRAVDEDLDSGLASLRPILHWTPLPDRGCTELKLCTWDRPRLFSRIAGACSASGLNILSAQIYSRADGIALDTFYVTDARAGGPVSKEQREQCTHLLNRVLERGDVDLYAAIHRQKLGASLYCAVGGERLPTRIQIDNDSAKTATVIDIITEDRLGLLYAISMALADAGLDVSWARITTEKGAAIDTFYVTHRYEGKLTSPRTQSTVRSKILGAILQLDNQR
ncbi:MAG: [protein-PII] uridylyltransferase [Verrucomicrobiae bacterium]|nr:[protein-PII] uridylyltransferase [Verrucomicrobiae bacterium]